MLLQFSVQSHPQVAEVVEEDLLQVTVRSFQVNPALTAAVAAVGVQAQVLVQEAEVVVTLHQ